MPTEPPPLWMLQQRQEIGDRVRAWGALRGVSQEWLAEEAGIDRKTVNRIENSTHPVGVDAYLRIAHALRIEPARLFPGSSEVRKRCRETMQGHRQHAMPLHGV
jgi:transcriptional regulator with XRE-family HTH domain